MPSTSKKQHNFMAAIANSPAFAKKAGVPQSVGEDFIAADKGRKFKQGGEMRESKAMMKKEVEFMKKKGAPASMLKHEKAEMKGMKSGGMARPKKDVAKDQMGMAPYGRGGMAKYASGGFVRSADGIAQRGKTKATQIKMKKGGAC